MMGTPLDRTGNRGRQETMTSLQRVLATLGFKEPDRAPFFLLLTGHGAAWLGMEPRDYFDSPEAMAEAQVAMQAHFGHDCVYSFRYAAELVEACGGELVAYRDGPPNAGAPVIRSRADIPGFRLPAVPGNPVLEKTLATQRLLKARVGDRVPVIGVVISPFSLPVMQLGFEAYLDLMLEDPDLLACLLEKNAAFCAEWGNAQLAAGATVICYFDPVSSTSMIPPELFRVTGLPWAARMRQALKGPVVVHYASGDSLELIPSAAEIGMAAVGVGTREDLGELKKMADGRITIFGGLNGLAMRNWSAAEAERQVRSALRTAAAGGGFILADSHGEIPWLVSFEQLEQVARSVHRWGHYPLDGV